MRQAPAVSRLHTPPRPTELAHLLLGRCIQRGDLVVDATAGNGHDALFLAQQVAPGGHVHAFDIQPEAIVRAQHRIAEAGLADHVTFHHTDHASMATRLPHESVRAVLFNLGYLPGSDRATTTMRDSTLTALHAAAQLLHSGGLLSLVCYPGHPQGAEELAEIRAMWPSWASAGWRIATYSLPFTTAASPVLWLATKP
jgi:tRNA1(Val) A37 N6-methylase TrmN6